MTRPHIPEEILSAAHARSTARRGQDWAEADRLKGIIEHAGWRVIDRGTDFRLEPALPPDLEEDGETVYGSSGSVPSRLAEPSDQSLSIVLLADGRAATVPMVARLRQTIPEVQIVAIVVGDEAAAERGDGDVPNGEVASPLPGDVETVRMVAGTGLAARLNAGLRRVTGSTVIVLADSIRLEGDVAAPLSAALADRAVAVAGPWGSRTADLRTYHPVHDGADVIDLACMAFRREDAVALGPLDERVSDEARVGAWWSLALRFGPLGPESDDPSRARRAVVVAVPASRPDAPPPDGPAHGEASRSSARRDFYRLHERFGPAFSGQSEPRP